MNLLFAWNFTYIFVPVEIFLIENQQSATDDRRGPCLFVDSKADGAHIKVTGCNETDERQNWVYTLKGQIMVSLEVNFSPRNIPACLTEFSVTGSIKFNMIASPSF